MSNQGQPHFKLGDRVRVIQETPMGGVDLGDLGSIVCRPGGGYIRVRLDGKPYIAYDEDWWPFKSNEIELVKNDWAESLELE